MQTLARHVILKTWIEIGAILAYLRTVYQAKLEMIRDASFEDAPYILTKIKI